jgi:hypothetical protein
MALIIDIKGKYSGSLPNVLSRIYRFRGFDGDTLTAQFKDGTTKIADVNRQLNEAWGFVNQRANIVGGKCNAYFQSLSRHKTLKQVLQEDDIVMHCLEPKPGHTFEDLPHAVTAGRDIAIDPTILFETSHVLGCTLIHELAHVAGATTDNSEENPHAGDAEEALHHCLCTSQFHLNTLGSIQTLTENGSRLV